MIAECDESGTILRKFVYGPGIDEPICMIDAADNNAVYYYHFDGLGSVIALSDANSEILERYSYDVFGEPNRTSDVNNPYLFTGRRPKDHYDKDGLRRKYKEWKELGKPRGGKTKAKKPWQKHAITALETVTNVTVRVFRTVSEGVVATGEWVYENPGKTGVIVVGAGIIVFDIVTVPSGEGTVGVVMIKGAVESAIVIQASPVPAFP